jgi:LEA14-like dessication related protein
MNLRSRCRTAGIATLAILLGGCAGGIENVLKTPGVELSSVEVVGLGFNSQTFLLAFDVSNPNPFALPIEAVRYGISLDGQRFASGSTDSAFTVPAGGAAQFAISVELDLLKTAPSLLSIVRQSIREDVGYQLDGEFTVGIPLAPPVAFSNRGAIRLHSRSD